MGHYCMNLEGVTALARNTPMDALCAAWGIKEEAVRARTSGRRPMSIRELGGLADIHGVTVLLDALDSPIDDVDGRQVQRVS